GVAVLVVQARDAGIEGAGQLAYPVLQDVGETQQQRQLQATFAQLLDLLVEVDALGFQTTRPHLHVPGLVEGEIAGAPVADAVHPPAVGHRPLAAVGLACASAHGGHLAAVNWPRACQFRSGLESRARLRLPQGQVYALATQGLRPAWQAEKHWSTG